MLKEQLPLGMHHFEVFDPKIGAPYPDCAYSHFCTGIDKAFFKKLPREGRLRIDGVDVGALHEAFTDFDS